MLRTIPPTDCTRAREAASARADGELSELEAAQLDGHLRGCPECAAFAGSLDAVARRLRGAELARPSMPVFVARRRRPALRLNTAAAAVALVAAAGSAFAVGHVVGSQGGSPTATVGGTLSAETTRRSEVLGMVRRIRPGRMAANDVIAV